MVRPMSPRRPSSSWTPACRPPPPRSLPAFCRPGTRRTVVPRSTRSSPAARSRQAPCRSQPAFSWRSRRQASRGRRTAHGPSTAPPSRSGTWWSSSWRSIQSGFPRRPSSPRFRSGSGRAAFPAGLCRGRLAPPSDATPCAGITPPERLHSQMRPSCRGGPSPRGAPRGRRATLANMPAGAASRVLVVGPAATLRSCATIRGPVVDPGGTDAAIRHHRHTNSPSGIGSAHPGLRGGSAAFGVSPPLRDRSTRSS